MDAYCSRVANCFTIMMSWGAAPAVFGMVRRAGADMIRVALPPSTALAAVGLVVAVFGAPSGAAMLDASHPARSAGPMDPATMGDDAAVILGTHHDAADSSARAKVMVFSKTAGFRHDSIETGVAAMKELLAPTSDVVATEDASLFTDEGLKGYCVVVFLNTTGDVLDDTQQAAFERFVEAGGGFVGVHAAADTEYDWPWYGRLVGAYFKGHPAIQEATVVRESTEHPSMSGWPERLKRTDEWYTYRSNPRSVKDMLILAVVDERSYEGGGMKGDHPISWCHEVGKGRAWYTGCGHTKESFSEPLFRSHLLGGVSWAGRISTDPSVAPRPAAAPTHAPAATPTPSP